MAKISQAKMNEGLALFAALGAAIPEETEIAATVSAYDEAAVKERRAAKIGEAEAVLRSLHYPHSLMMKRCNWCGEAFQTNYCAVGSCSDTCRKRYFEEHYKIPWNVLKTKTWGEYEPPQVVTAKSVKELYEWATAFIADYDRVSSLAEPEENPMRPREQVTGIDAEGFTTIQYLDQEGSTGRQGFLPESLSGAQVVLAPIAKNQFLIGSPSDDLQDFQTVQFDPGEIEIDLDF